MRGREPGIEYGIGMARLPWERHKRNQRDGQLKQRLLFADLPVSADDVASYKTLEGEPLIFRLEMLCLTTRKELRAAFQEANERIRAANKPLKKKNTLLQRQKPWQFYPFVAHLRDTLYIPVLERFLASKDHLLTSPATVEALQRERQASAAMTDSMETSREDKTDIRVFGEI